jgi:2-polyprenyl-3-methyl-5-hydroxy-6-metoxy-1,4-benzoquinol methylase
MTDRDEGLAAASPCRVCAATESRVLLARVRDYITGEHFSVHACAGCGLAATYPRPASLDRFYPAYYRRYGFLARRVLAWLYRLRVRSWAGTLEPAGRVLEVGCGGGWMLRALADRGWKVAGIERTADSASYARRLNRVPVFIGELEALKPGPQFDLVVLFQVLEHLPDPLLTLRRCAALLKPGGHLIVSVPNLRSWQARVAGTGWFHLDVPRHLFHFTPETLAALLDRTGFQVKQTRFVSFEHDPYGWEQSLLNQLGFEQNLLTRALMGDRCRRLLSPSGLAMMATGALIALPGMLLAWASWLAGTGAIMEVVAVRREAGANRGRGAVGR